jgi:hypothetical protein
MLRTIEVLIAIIILFGAFVAVTYFAVLPLPRQVAPMNLRRLALTTLESLESNHDLSNAAFATPSDIPDSANWRDLQVALSASLPADVIYNLTVYAVNSSGAVGSNLYTVLGSISNAATLGAASDASSYMVASSDVSFAFTPEKIGEHGTGGTLYILNCSDANGWWITGYTAQSLAEDLYKLLSPYYLETIMVQNTSDLRKLLDGQKISGSANESVQDATIINTFGESVPMPQEYYQSGSRHGEGYDPDAPKGTGYDYGYVKYCYTLGQKTRERNWTWSSIVGYPFYYVSNTNATAFQSEQNSWGIYGMKQTNQGGLRAFLQGLDNQQYHYDNSGAISNVGQVTLTQTVINASNYYGIYPSSTQTSTRALSILSGYNLTVGLNVFNPVGNYLPGSIYKHVFTGASDTTGVFLAIGLTRTPDIRITTLGLLSYYHPSLFASGYTISDTSRLVVLQLGLVGGS